MSERPLVENQVPDTVPVGCILDFGCLTPPTNWMTCDGSAVNRATYAALFAILGTSYGSGDGINTFNLPDFRGRLVVGAGLGSGLTNRSRGELGGEEAHSLYEYEAGPHYHNILAGYGSVRNFHHTNTGAGGFLYDWDFEGQVTNYQGNNFAHNTMQPFGVINKIIKVL